MNKTNLLFECIDIKNGEKLPITNTGRGEDISPGFLIKNLSPHAETLAITLEDTTHPLFNNFTHWLIWNIPASDKIPENIPHGKRIPAFGNAGQGIAYGWHRYAGPKPPKGRTHLYRFTLYALDTEINLTFLPIKSRFLKKASGHILQQGSIACKFE